jgi:hypothetical protein
MEARERNPRALGVTVAFDGGKRKESSCSRCDCVIYSTARGGGERGSTPKYKGTPISVNGNP